MRLCFILETDLDEFEGDDDEGFCCSCGCAGEGCEGLVHLGDAEEVAVELSPLVVGGEFGGSVKAIIVSDRLSVNVYAIVLFKNRE